jgi:hypothetical protein
LGAKELYLFGPPLPLARVAADVLFAGVIKSVIWQEKIGPSPYLRRKRAEIGLREIIGSDCPQLERGESIEKAIRQIKRIFIAIAGFTVLLIGITDCTAGSRNTDNAGRCA